LRRKSGFESRSNFRYPVFLDVAGKHCLVTGEGFEIPAKVNTLAALGAAVRYVNPTAEVSIRDLAESGLIQWKARPFEPRDLDGCLLVITDCEDNEPVFRAAEERNVLCNAADDPEFCRFSFGSVVSRDDLTVAISTNGVAPALAVRLRERLERELGEEYAQFLKLLGDLRVEITESLSDFRERRALWYRIVDSEALAMMRRGETGKARQLVRALIDEGKRAAAQPL
jgi:siroheme synthase-like protein